MVERVEPPYCPFIGMVDETKRDITVSLPLYKNYSYGSRWPLPSMIITVPEEDNIRAIKRLADEIKEEANVKLLIVKCGSITIQIN